MEEWQKIDNFPNYSVSNFGNVINTKTNKVMKLTNKSGYYHITLKNENSYKTLKIHRLVALAFIKNPENKPEVNHKDKNKLNNNINNLEWMTRTENNKHRCNGLLITCNKNKPISRLNKDTNEVLEHYNSIEDAGKWAFETNLTCNSHNGRNAIGNCINGLSNSAYGYKWKYIENKNLENEEWKEINLLHLFGEMYDSNKKYFVSNLGRFKNSFGKIMDNYKVNENGYIRIYIYKKTFTLHRLVALTFLENFENKKQVNHKDGNKLNNSIENLEWVTNKENQIHKIQNALGNNFTRKIGQYDLSGNLLKQFKSIVKASEELNMSVGTIKNSLKKNHISCKKYFFKYL